MKRKLKKILRFLLVFISSFALVCVFFPKNAIAQEYDGNDYTFTDSLVHQTELYIDLLYQKLEESGFTVVSDIANNSQSVKDKAFEWGIDIYNATGEYINTANEYLNTVKGVVIDFTNPFIQDFVQGAKDWKITDTANTAWDFYYNIFKKFFTYSDFAIINDYQLNFDNYTNEGRNNIDKYFSFKNYGLSRGNYTNIPSDSFTSDNWDIPSSMNFRFQYTYSYSKYPEQGVFWADYFAFTVSDISETINNSYTDPWGVTIEYTYSNGKLYYDFDFDHLADGILINGDFRVLCRFTTNSYGDDSRIIRVVSSSLIGGIPISSVVNCQIVNGNTVNILNDNGNYYSFYCHVLNNGEINFYWGDYSFGGVTAPSPPIFSIPISGGQNYDSEMKNYQYFTTETDRLLDELDINDIGKILESVDDYSWFTFPLRVYNEFGDVLRDNYSPVLIFDIDEIDLSFVADGLKFPAVRFSFSPDVDLDEWGGYLFTISQYIIAFGYFWALLLWGRSLILRIGSDTIHRDYED